MAVPGEGGNAATKGGRGKSKSTKSMTRSSKAGLQFPVARYLKKGRYAQRIGSGSAFLEYLAAEVMELDWAKAHPSGS